jgi:predicted transcriptional regulator
VPFKRGSVPADKNAILGVAWMLRRFDGQPSTWTRGMPPDSSEAGTGKTRKRSTLKTPARQAASKVKSTIHLSVEASQRLDIHATMMGMDRSALVEKLINDHLRRYVVSDRGGMEDAANAESAA